MVLPMLALLAFGCARTVVSPRSTTYSSTIPRPEQVLVYDFAVSVERIEENQSVIRRLSRSSDREATEERELDIGEKVAARFVERLISDLRDRGWNAIHATQSTPVGHGDLQIIGHLLRVDEGNRMRRAIVGFGAGRSYVDARLAVFSAVEERKQLLEFVTHADSGSMPGAAATMGAGAAAQGGVTAGVAAANVGVGGVKTYKSGVERMAAKSADEAVKYLEKYFAVQGWTAP